MNDKKILAAIESLRQDIGNRLDSIKQRLAASEKPQRAIGALCQCLDALCEEQPVRESRSDGEAAVHSEDIAATIKALRKSAGLTQRELAEKSGVSYSYVTKLEGGYQDNPTVAVLKAIEEATQSADASSQKGGNA